MKILYIAPKAPLPVKDGGCFAMLQTLQSLAEMGPVNALILETHKHPLSAEAREELLDWTKQIYSLTIDTRLKPVHALWHFLKGSNYNLARFRSPAIRKQLKTILHEPYDVIVCDSLFAAAESDTIRRWSNAKRIIRMHNLEADLWEQQASQCSGLFKKWYLKSLSRTLRKAENNLLQQADALWTITKEDRERLCELQISTTAVVIPVALPSTDLEVNYSNGNCFHLGSMNWKPNQEAVIFLVEQVWQGTGELPELTIAGSFSEQLQLIDHPEVNKRGEVDDALYFMATHGILVSPIQSGSGVRIKLLEALSLGVPCITTALGAQGINVSEAGIILAETAEDFRREIRSLSQNEARRRELGGKGKTYIAKYHSFAVVNNQMLLTLEG